jgi:hypothetical protein
MEKFCTAVPYRGSMVYVRGDALDIDHASLEKRAWYIARALQSEESTGRSLEHITHMSKIIACQGYCEYPESVAKEAESLKSHA